MNSRTQRFLLIAPLILASTFALGCSERVNSAPVDIRGHRSLPGECIKIEKQQVPKAFRQTVFPEPVIVEKCSLGSLLVYRYHTQYITNSGKICRHGVFNKIDTSAAKVIEFRGKNGAECPPFSERAYIRVLSRTNFSPLSDDEFLEVLDAIGNPKTINSSTISNSEGSGKIPVEILEVARKIGEIHDLSNIDYIMKIRGKYLVRILTDPSTGGGYNVFLARSANGVLAASSIKVSEGPD